MNPASLIKNYLSIVDNITSELDSLRTFDPNYLMSQFDSLQTSFLNLAKLTNNGRGPSELRTEKLKALKKWLQAYSDKEQFLQTTVPQRYKNKPVAIDSTILDTYQGYANSALDYMAEMPAKYQDIKEEVLLLLAMRKQIFKNLNSFQLDEADLLALAAKHPSESVVEGVVHTPTKTINTIRSILRAYGRFIKSVEAAQQEILPMLNFFEGMTLEQIYGQFNRRNRLLQSLVKNLSNIKKAIEQNSFQHKLAIVKDYQAMLEEMTEYLPQEVIQKLSLTTLTSPLEDELARSPKNVKKYNPLKDPGMNWPAPVKPIPVAPTKELPVEEAEELPPDTVREYPTEEKREGDALSAEERRKYEKLWEAQASLAAKKLIRLATYLEFKYL